MAHVESHAAPNGLCGAAAATGKTPSFAVPRRSHRDGAGDSGGGGPPSEALSTFASGALLLTLFAVCLLLFSIKHTDVLVRMLSSSPHCNACSSMLRHIDMIMPGKQDALLAAKRDTAALKTFAIGILRSLCPNTGGALGSQLRPQGAESGSPALAAHEEAVTSDSRRRSGLVHGRGAGVCGEVVAARKRQLVAYVLNATDSSAMDPHTICFEFCEASLSAPMRAVVAFLRLSEHPAIIAVRSAVEDVWGAALVLAVIGTLLGMILQARVRASRILYAAALRKRRLDAARTRLPKAQSGGSMSNTPSSGGSGNAAAAAAAVAATQHQQGGGGGGGNRGT